MNVSPGSELWGLQEGRKAQREADAALVQRLVSEIAILISEGRSRELPAGEIADLIAEHLAAKIQGAS